jgi:glycerol uptake facilitator-like aquaporin
MTISLPRRLASEFIGTLFLLAAVIGSAIMGERLAAGNQAVALLANSLATGAALVAIIHTFGSISGAHLNPAVTLAAAWTGDLPWLDAPAYILAQVSGAIAGAATAHLMFNLPILSATAPDSSSENS